MLRTYVCEKEWEDGSMPINAVVNKFDTEDDLKTLQQRTWNPIISNTAGERFLPLL